MKISDWLDVKEAEGSDMSHVVLPDDMVYDTTEEEFTIVIEKLEIGEHIITVRISDDVGNTTYKTFEVKVNSES